MRRSIYNLLSVILLILVRLLMVSGYVHMHFTDRRTSNGIYHDCLLHFEEIDYAVTLSQVRKTNPYELIPLCIRPYHLSNDTFFDVQLPLINGVPISFETLKRQNITSENLYLWYASVDVIERYQAYLENSKTFLSTEEFNNCSSSWFGEYCQYKLIDYTNNRVEKNNFRLPVSPRALTTIGNACYLFLTCNLGSPEICLDWREICDGKMDCLNDGIDESGCEEIELNECKSNEFRCDNGFCIPKEFFNDDYNNPDCIDRSDERMIESFMYSDNSDCTQEKIFRCEETKCRNERFSSCGDGSCSMMGCFTSRLKTLKFFKLDYEQNRQLSFDCWKSVVCMTSMFFQLGHDPLDSCQDVEELQANYRKNCPALFFFPAEPYLLNHVYFVYTNSSRFEDSDSIVPSYVCYDKNLCDWMSATRWINGSACRLYSEIIAEYLTEYYFDVSTLLRIFLRCSTTKSQYVDCPKHKPVRCANSTKCISHSRVYDKFLDCPLGDDENITDSCALPDIDYRFRCTKSYECVPMLFTIGKTLECQADPYWPLPIKPEKKKKVIPLTFQLLCDGHIENDMIDGLNYTDETDCQYWPCSNTYTRCDRKGIFNCPDGSDEANCSYNPCAPDRLPCVSPLNYSLTCITLSYINNGHIDCISGYDEVGSCPTPTLPNNINIYRCINTTKCVDSYFVCADETSSCPLGDDQGSWCKSIYNVKWLNWINSTFRLNEPTINRDLMHQHFFTIGRFKDSQVHFTLKNHLDYPAVDEVYEESDDDDDDETPPPLAARSNRPVIVLDWQTLDQTSPNINCFKGLPILINNLTQRVCLCSPGYFGDQCQYQSQRVSLTLQFRVVEWRKIFNFVIILIDDDTNIQSVEQIEYIGLRDCQKKFSVYLLYLSQPKNISTNYSVRVDVYYKENMQYYSSLIYPIRYNFLPVHRLSIRINVPIEELLFIKRYCPLNCIHGQCKFYSNVQKYFCQCSEGYSGQLCTKKITCDCSLDSLCIGLIKNQSICMCPLDKFGRRCYLKRTPCASNQCLSSGRCLVKDERFNQLNHFCVCPYGYAGSRCEKNLTKIEFQFSSGLSIPQTILIHMIYVEKEMYDTRRNPLAVDPLQTTLVAKIKYNQKSTYIYYPDKFHLIFIEYDKNYYHVFLRKKFILSKNISTIFSVENRCASVKELFNESIWSLSKWHRAKYYHIPCQRNNKLMCFYDRDYFMCICDNDRHANCFRFDQSPSYDCSGYNYCLNGGQCYHDNNTCPTASLCVCDKCYFGGRCQFTTQGFGLSLDDILGYSIQPNISFVNQPTVVKVATSFTLVMSAVAIVNGFLSVITFQTKRSLEVGCGRYLLALSITSFVTMSLFAIKFLILLLSQMLIITNQKYLLINCILMEFFLKALLATGDWFNACVAIERTVTVQLGVKFRKKKSKQIAKYIIILVYLVTLANFVVIPIHQHLLNDAEEGRTWCVLRYSSPVRRFASFVHGFHFLIPLSINFGSVVYLITLLARQKSRSRAESYREHLLKQFRLNRHLLLSSLSLIIISVPRLIISLVSECMKSVQNLWLYLAGYFISFLPPLLTFVLFVLPSEFYRTELKTATVHIRRYFRPRHH